MVQNGHILPSLPDLARARSVRSLIAAGLGSLRTRLLLLVLVTAAPLVGITAVAVSEAMSIDRERAEAALVNHVRLTAILADRDVADQIAFLRNLARSPLLHQADLAGFAIQLREALASRPGGIITVTGADGREVLSTGPQTSALPERTAAVAQVIKTGAPQVYSPMRSDPSHRLAIGIAVPSQLNEDRAEIDRVLALEYPAAHLQALLPIEDLPPAWIVAFMDSNDIVVARNRRSEDFVGTPVIAPIRKALAAGAAEVIRTRNVEGVAATIAVAHAPLTGFSAAIAIPGGEFDAPMLRTLQGATVAGLLLVLPAILMAVLLARRIAASLKNAAQEIASGGTPLGGFPEIADLISALRSAWRERDAADGEIRAREAKLRGVLDAMPLSVLLRDGDGRLVFVNRYARAYFGEVPLDTTQPLTGWVHQDDREAYAAWRARWLSGAGAAQAEQRWRRSDGTYRWHLNLGVTIRDEASGRDDFCAVALDVNDTHEAQRALDAANAALETQVQERTRELSETASALAAQLAEREVMQAALLQSQKMEALGQLTGGAAHDFNNVLAAVENSLGVIAAVSDEPVVQEATALARAAVDRAATIVRHLLAFARKQDLMPGTVELPVLIGAFATLCQQTVGEAIVLRCELEQGVWTCVADDKALQVALLNLAINARDAMTGGGTIVLSARNASADPSSDDAPPRDLAPGDYVVVAMRDNGSGMSPEVLERAAEPFFTTKPDGLGTGLGLAMAYGFARQSGGGLRIASEPGRGTTVRLFLPRGAASAPDRPVVVPTAAVALDRRHRILVVDDNDAVRRSAAMLLRVLGYDVMQAASADEAFQITSCGLRPDMVLSDMVMPGGGGRQLAQRLHDAFPGLPVVLMTGYADETSASPDYVILSKPFTRRQLSDVVEAALAS